MKSDNAYKSELKTNFNYRTLTALHNKESEIQFRFINMIK